MRGHSDGPGIGLAAENGGNPGLAFLLMDVKISDEFMEMDSRGGGVVLLQF